MSRAQLRNAGWYVLYALVGAIVTTGLHLSQVLAGSDPIVLRPLLATFSASLFGSLATAFGAAQLGRYGSEHLTKQVKLLVGEGYRRDDLIVVPRSGMRKLARLVKDKAKADPS